MSSLAEFFTKAKQLLAAQEQENVPVKREHRIVQLAWLSFLEWQPTDSVRQTVRTYLLERCGIDRSLLDANANQPYHKLISLLKPLAQEHPGILYSFYGGLLELLNDNAKQKRSRTKKQCTFFYTPLAVAHFMMDILNPQPGEKIYDPACGSCGMLIEASRNTQTLTQPLLGCERDPSALALGIMHMALHNLDISGIQYRDALIQPDLFHQEYSVVSDIHVLPTHPSFGNYGNQSKSEKCEGVPPYHESRILKHCMDVLNEHGRCAIIVGLNVLSSANEGHIPLRQRLFHDYTIQMIISLPPKTFGKYSNYRTFLLVFAAGGETRQTLCYNLPRRVGPVCADDFEPIRAIWPEWKTYLEGKESTNIQSLPDGAWIETYNNIFHDVTTGTGQETQINRQKNPYSIVPTPPIKNMQLESPSILAERITRGAEELQQIAQRLREKLNQKELDI